MASPYAPTEPDTADSVASTPRSQAHNDDPSSAAARVRFMCSFGGKILPRPHDNQLRYVGGDTRIVAVQRHTSFSSLLSKLSKLAGTTSISIKYQLPNEDLDSLITVTTDEDVENMIEEYDRLGAAHKTGSARLRVFLFPNEAVSRASSISSLLDGSAKRQNWFVDALNGGSGGVLERGRSEVSSIVSEVPDYLFGLDNSDEAPKDTKLNKNKTLLNDNVSVSDPGSPAPVVSSPFCSTSSTLAPPGMIPDLPPVKTRPVNLAEAKEVQLGEVLNEKMVTQQTGYTGSPMWRYQNPTVQHMPAVYYVPGPVQPGTIPVQPGNIPVQTVPVGAQYVQQYPGQVPVGFSQPVSSMGPIYSVGGAVPGRVLPEHANHQAMYYAAARNAPTVPGPGTYPGMVVSAAGDELQGSGTDGLAGRVGHAS